MENKIVSYAQNKEDIILSAFFPDVEQGFYVDIGAHHPVNDSVTKYFYEKGWHGINVEPNKKFHKLLINDRPNDLNINVGIADKSGTLTYREYKNGDGLSTFSSKMQKEYEKNSNIFTESYVDHDVPVITLTQLFEEYNVKKIHFLKIDIEGFEYEALVGNDWSLYRPEIVCVEANHIIKDWKKLLKDNGYILAFDDGLNEYYSSSKERADKFSYVEKAINKTVIYFEDQQKLIDFEDLKKKYNYYLDRHSDVEKEYLREIAYRDNLINESKRFKKSFITFIRAIDNIILVHINLMNHPKRKHATKNIDISDELTNKGIDEIIKIARKNDMQNFYTLKKGSGQFERQYFYETIMFTYTFFKKSIKWALLKIIKVLRAIKRKVRQR